MKRALAGVKARQSFTKPRLCVSLSVYYGEVSFIASAKPMCSFDKVLVDWIAWVYGVQARHDHMTAAL